MDAPRPPIVEAGCGRRRVVPIELFEYEQRELLAAHGVLGHHRDSQATAPLGLRLQRLARERATEAQRGDRPVTSRLLECEQAMRWPRPAGPPGTFEGLLALARSYSFHRALSKR